MTSHIEGKGNDKTPPSSARAADGLIDFGSYTTQQLSDLRLSIDPDRFPLNYANLEAELSRRETASDYDRIDLNWTRRDGILGSLEALGRGLPLYGRGYVVRRDNGFAIGGWSRTWLGIPVQVERVVSAPSIRNVSRDDLVVEFEVTRGWWWPARFRAGTFSAESASQLVAQLPTQVDEYSARLMEWHRQLHRSVPVPWVTWLLVLANIAMFGALAVQTGKVAEYSILDIVDYGGLAGGLVLNGELWRLLSATFLHLDPVHLVVNMWVLWSVGRVLERLIGNWTFLLLYASTGILACLASMMWDPGVVAAGASGAIFGIVGAFLSFLVRRRTRIPGAIVRSHLIPTLIFAGLSLYSGFGQMAVDNAAHVGGFLAGLLLGTILARPVTERRVSVVARKWVAAGVVSTALATLVLYYLSAFSFTPTPPERFAQLNDWYVRGAVQNLQTWQEIGAQAASGQMSDDELGMQFKMFVAPFWESASAKLAEGEASLPEDLKPYAALILSYARKRHELAMLIVELSDDPSASVMTRFEKASDESMAIEAQIERLSTRYILDRGIRGLPDSKFGNWLRYGLGKWDCVREPESYSPRVAETDSRYDTPYLQDELGCLAQRLFMSGEYATLEGMMDHASADTGSLPDGSSGLDAIVYGISDLADFGDYPILQILTHTSDWRRSVPDSLNADLVEAAIYLSWAYQARGRGSMSTVSKQSSQMFAYRNEMARTTLNEMTERAANEPAWYALKLQLGRVVHSEQAGMRAVYDEGFKRFPKYRTLQTRMLGSMMPRWNGSLSEVDAFIEEYSTPGNTISFADYAILYLLYGNMEQDDFNVVTDGYADGSSMDLGVRALRLKYPGSDYILNLAVRYYCIQNDKDAYLEFRKSLDGHVSTQAWPDTLRVEDCDKKFAG